jgi:bifunctional non-homologous end joining protein LigD
MSATPGGVARLSEQEWAFEVKWDGYRLIVELDGAADPPSLVLRSRSGLDVTDRYPRLARLADELAGHSVVIDGEAVVFDENGAASLGLLQISGARAGLVAFDVLYLDGVSLLRKRYSDRRRVLETLAAIAPSMAVAPTLPGDGAQALRYSCDHGLEGVVAKRRDSVYLPGKRGHAWVKEKNWRTQRVTVGGWRAGRGGRAGGIGSLLVGLEQDGRLHYAGRVGTGFTDALLARLQEQLTPLVCSEPPFVDSVPAEDRVDVVWVHPVVHADVRYLEWTDSGKLRHPALVRVLSPP